MIAIDAAVYFKTGGVADAAAYAELDIVGEVTGDDARTESQVKLRGQDNVLYNVGMRDNPVTFQILHEPTNAGYIALKSAYEGRTDIGLAFLDDEAATGVEGWEADYKISQFGKPQPVDETWFVSVKAVPSAKSGAVKPRDYQHPAI